MERKIPKYGNLTFQKHSRDAIFTTSSDRERHLWFPKYFKFPCVLSSKDLFIFWYNILNICIRNKDLHQKILMSFVELQVGLPVGLVVLKLILRRIALKTARILEGKLKINYFYIYLYLLNLYHLKQYSGSWNNNTEKKFKKKYLDWKILCMDIIEKSWIMVQIRSCSWFFSNCNISMVGFAHSRTHACTRSHTHIHSTYYFIFFSFTYFLFI